MKSKNNKKKQPPPKAKKKNGRPSIYTQDLADEICRLISTTSMGLKSICKEVGINIDTVFDWRRTNPSFSDKYAKAKQEQADMMAEEIHEVADEALRLSKKGISAFRLSGLTAAARLKIDALKWTASKLKPKSWGDKIDVTTDGKQIKGNVLWLGGKKPASDEK